MQTIINATVSVDTFFLLSGMLVSYLFLRELDRNKGRFNILLFYFHRYFRCVLIRWRKYFRLAWTIRLTCPRLYNQIDSSLWPDSWIPSHSFGLCCPGTVLGCSYTKWEHLSQYWLEELPLHQQLLWRVRKFLCFALFLFDKFVVNAWFIHQCMGETWYLACDMQLFFLSPLFIYPMWRWRNIGPSVTVGAIAASLVASVIVWNEYGFSLQMPSR